MHCLLKQTFNLAGKHIGNDDERFLFIMRVMREINGIDRNMIAPLIAGKIHRIFREFTNNNDPYRKDKDFYNKKMLSLGRDFEGFIAGAENKLFRC